MPPGSRYAKGWRLTLPDAGVLLDGIVHHIAGMRVLLEANVKTVMARCSRKGDTFAGCDTVSGTLTFSNNISASILVTYVSSTFLWELQVIGTDGDIIIRRRSDHPGYILSLLTPTNSAVSNKEMEIPFNGLDAEFEAFVDSCNTAMVHPDLDAHMAFNDLATVEALFESSQKGRLVTVKSLTPLSQLGMVHAPAKTL